VACISSLAFLFFKTERVFGGKPPNTFLFFSFFSLRCQCEREKKNGIELYAVWFFCFLIFLKEKKFLVDISRNLRPKN
jgi:hypothetical protein